MGSDRQMMRGKAQALYKYLPESWIDFSVRGKDRKQYIAKVVRWNSEKLSGVNKINEKRLIRSVNDAVQAFANQGSGGDSDVAPISGFGSGLTNDNCDILTPKVSDTERGIVAQISPLTFYCKKCYRVYQFNSEQDYKKRCKCETCHIELTQFRQIYFCQCGYATDVHPIRCPVHGSKYIKWNGKYDFYCAEKNCNRKIAMHVKCPVCKKDMGPKVALDPSQFIPFNLNLIDLIDERFEDFIANTDYGKYITIAYWLGKISREDLLQIIDKGIVTDAEKYNKIYQEHYNMIFNILHDEIQANLVAKMEADKECGNKYNKIINDIKIMIKSCLNFSKLPEMILEYDMVKNLPNVATLDDAMKTATLLNTNSNPKIYKQCASKFGISEVKACDEIPFISCSYGFTRKESEYKPGVQLHGFRENNKKCVYAIKMYTEGVLFEFDRRKILEWMEKNEFVDFETSIKDCSDEDIKMWFINNIKAEIIHPFESIQEKDSPETFYVYNLIHSIAHLLIRAAADIGGLGKDSLSEYIFAGIPAVLIYCQNSQGFNLGSLFNTFEAYFDKWLNKARSIANKCVFDPVCIERHKACTGCLFLNEVSCEHFNKDLDRSLLIGHLNKETRKRIIGFWEEE